jgi:hypothetical protein
MPPRLFLAFAHDEDTEDTIGTRLKRALLGPVEHVEFVMRDGKTMTRYLVAKPTRHHDSRVFKTSLAMDETATDWYFLRIVLEDTKIALIIAFLEEAIAKRHYFTNARMAQASGVTLPSWLWDLLIGKDEIVDNPGSPMYCAELCMLALQHVGLLEYYPADSCTPNDLRLMASEFTEKTILNPSVGTDALGLRLSDESLMLA